MRQFSQGSGQRLCNIWVLLTIRWQWEHRSNNKMCSTIRFDTSCMECSHIEAWRNKDTKWNIIISNVSICNKLFILHSKYEQGCYRTIRNKCIYLWQFQQVCYKIIENKFNNLLPHISYLKSIMYKFLSDFMHYALFIVYLIELKLVRVKSVHMVYASTW